MTSFCQRRFTQALVFLSGVVFQTGDERWRISSADRTVTLVEMDGGANRTCTVSVMDGKALGAPIACSELDVALAPFPSRNFVERPFLSAVGFMQVWNSYPILSDEDTEVHCYGS